MTWTLEPELLQKLEALWALYPPGTHVRALTQPLAQALVGAVGPDDGARRAAQLLGETHGIYLSALALKMLAGEVDTLLHAVGIAAALPFVLGGGERVLRVSLDHHGGGVGEVDDLGGGDLVTDRQIAEFTFMHWDPTKSNGSRDTKLLKDLVKLDSIADSSAAGRRRILYVAGKPTAQKFLRSGQALKSKLRGDRGYLERIWQKHGETTFTTVGEYWSEVSAEGRVELVDLHEVAPELAPVDA